MFAALLYFAPPVAAAPIEIVVNDPAAHAVVLRCGNRVEREAIKDGVATFAFFPEECVVDVIARKGTIQGPGSWTCDDQGCTLQSVDHLPLQSGPGRLNVVIPGDHVGNLTGDLRCPSGHRERVPIERNTLVFTDVPNETCKLTFRGGQMVHSPELTPGDWTCRIEDQPTICQPRGARPSTP